MTKAPQITLTNRDMTGDELREARATLGAKWGLDRPLTPAEMGRLVRLRGVSPSSRVLAYERDKRIPGPMALAIELLATLDVAPPWAFTERPRGRPRRADADA